MWLSPSGVDVFLPLTWALGMPSPNKISKYNFRPPVEILEERGAKLEQ